MYDGVINVYKEKGFTSHDVVAKLRGILRQKKIGHTGTLDPDAVGVLPVCLGKGTKLCDVLTDKSKAYRAVLLLGVETDTEDAGGEILNRCPPERLAALTEEAVTQAMEPEDREVYQAVLALPRKYRTALHLHYYEGYSVTEIAALTGAREGTVKSWLSRGREKLAVELKGDD